MPVAPSDVRDLRRDAVRLAHSAGRTRDRTANAAVNALSNPSRNHLLSSSPASHTLLPSGQIYTGALAPPASTSRLHSSPSSGNLTPNGSQSNLYLATAPTGSGSSIGLGYGLTAPDNMRAQKQAAKDKKAKIKKRKAVQAQVAASALAGRSESSLLLAGSGLVASSVSVGPVSSGRASPAVSASARASGDEQNTATIAAASAAGAPRITRRSSSSSNLNNTTVTVVASTSNTAASGSSPGAQASSTGETASAATAPTSPARPRRRRTQGRSSGVGASTNAVAAASELASQTESRPYNLYQEMLGASSDEERALGEGPSANAQSTSARLPAHSVLPVSSSAVPQPPAVNSNLDAEAHVQLSVQDTDLAAAQATTMMSVPEYPPPPFPSGSYSTRPRTPPTPPPPLRPPDPTMSEAFQQEERAKERAWEAYRAKWVVPDSPPPAFRSDDEDGPGTSNRAQRSWSPRRNEGDVDHASGMLAAVERPDPRYGAEESDLSSAESEVESISSARRAWEEDLRSGYDLPERIAREADRRAAVLNAVTAPVVPESAATDTSGACEQESVPITEASAPSEPLQGTEVEHDESTHIEPTGGGSPASATASPDQEFQDAENTTQAVEISPEGHIDTSDELSGHALVSPSADQEQVTEAQSSEPDAAVEILHISAAVDTLSIPATAVSESSEYQWQAEEEAFERMEAEESGERPTSTPSDTHINENDVEDTQYDTTVPNKAQSGMPKQPPSTVEFPVGPRSAPQNAVQATKHDEEIRSSPISDSPSDPTRMDSEASPYEEDDGHSSIKLTTAETSESSDEQWAAEDEAFERLQAKEQAVLRLRLRAEAEDSSDDEAQSARSRVSGSFKRLARDVLPPSASSPQQQLQALAQLHRTVPRAPPPLALGRSRSGAAFSSSSEESSDDEERRLESTGSEPEDEGEEGTSLSGSRRSSAASSVRSVDQTALAAFNYLRARTLQLTGRDPLDDSLESSPGGSLLASAATHSVPSTTTYTHRQPPIHTSASRHAPASTSNFTGVPSTQSYIRAHFVENAADDDAIAAHVASQFSSAQKGKAPVRPVDHLLFNPDAGSATTATPLPPPPVQEQQASPAPRHRPLPVPPRITTMRTPPVAQGWEQPAPRIAPPPPPTLSEDVPVLPPRPSEIDDSLPLVGSPSNALDRRSLGSRLKGLFGTSLEGAGSGEDLIPSETADKIRGLFDQPVIPRPSIEAQRSAVHPSHTSAARPTPIIAPAVQIHRVDPSDDARRPGAYPSDSSITIPVSPILSLQDAKETEEQVDKIAHHRRESLRALENRFAPRTNTLDVEPQTSGLTASSSPTTAASTSPSQLSYNEDRPLSTHAAVSGGPGLSRSGAISGRSGPPPPAFFTRRFGPRPASFVNPRSGDAPRPLGRLPTITAATRHYEPAKRAVPTTSGAVATEAVPAHADLAAPPGPPPAAGTPSWLAHIPPAERSQLPPPIDPIRLHIPDDQREVLLGGSGVSSQDGTEFPVAARSTITPLQRPVPASSVGDLDDPRTIALLRRPPPPPPPPISTSLTRAATQAATMPQRNVASSFVDDPPEVPATGPRAPVDPSSNVRTRNPFRSSTRPLPSIPTVSAEIPVSRFEHAPSPVQAPTSSGPTPLGPEETLEGEALLQRARSALRRPPRREPSLGITDLDLLVSELERNGDHYEDLNAISEFLGPVKSNKPTAAELAALSIAKVELDRRRVDRAGRVKQKLSVAGVRVDRCGICLSQFKEGEECCIYPCWHIFHNKPCATQVLLNSRLCPMCRKDIAAEEA